MVSIALFEPEIPQNTGNILRLADCLGIKVLIIEPCGFIFGGKDMKRASLDYLNTVQYSRFVNWEAFEHFILTQQKNIIISSTKGKTSYYDHKFKHNEVILFGKESAGLPANIMQKYEKITIKMQPNKRSLNLSSTVAIIISEAIRQLI